MSISAALRVGAQLQQTWVIWVLLLLSAWQPSEVMPKLSNVVQKCLHLLWGQMQREEICLSGAGCWSLPAANAGSRSLSTAIQGFGAGATVLWAGWGKGWSTAHCLPAMVRWEMLSPHHCLHSSHWCSPALLTRACDCDEPMLPFCSSCISFPRLTAAALPSPGTCLPRKDILHMPLSLALCSRRPATEPRPSLGAASRMGAPTGTSWPH